MRNCKRFVGTLLFLPAVLGISIRAADNVHAEVAASYGRLPLHFEANRGQADPAVKFLVRAPDYTLFLTSTEAVVAKPQTRALRLRLVESDPAARLEGKNIQGGRSHYLLGNSEAAWHTNVDSYSRVELQQPYPGVNLVYYGNRNQLEYDFVVAPGADPTVIGLSFGGASAMRVDGRGDLVLRINDGELRHRKPRAYQTIDGIEREVFSRYIVRGKLEVGFELGTYDRSRPLVIDPVLSFSTYLEGSGDDRAYGIAVDPAGCAYIVGETGSVDFPKAGAAQTAFGGYTDVFVSKLNATGTALVYSTYLGGSSRDSGRAIALDAAGNAYITGFTYSRNFPVTAGAAQSSPGGASAVFVAKLNPSGSALLYSTYLRGSGSDYGTAIAVDSSGSAYVTGYTSSLDFPITAGAFQTTFGGGGSDAFVAKLNSSGSALNYSTYLWGRRFG
jgi:hypothetical protein